MKSGHFQQGSELHFSILWPALVAEAKRLKFKFDCPISEF